MVYIFWLGTKKLLKEPTQIMSNLENTSFEKRFEKVVISLEEKETNQREDRNESLSK